MVTNRGPARTGPDLIRYSGTCLGQSASAVPDMNMHLGTGLPYRLFEKGLVPQFIDAMLMFALLYQVPKPHPNSAVQRKVNRQKHCNPTRQASPAPNPAM